MRDVYFKMWLSVILGLIGFLLLNEYQNSKIRKAKRQFEEMMKCRGLSLEPITKGETYGNQRTEEEPQKRDT